MRLTVLGCNGSFPGPGGACSGYLVEEGHDRLLLDCGNGVLSRLQELCPIESLTAILLTHLHFDHMADLLVLRYGLETRVEMGEQLKPIPLFLPDAPEEIAALLHEGDVFERHPIVARQNVQLGLFSVSFVPMRHSVEAYAIRVRAGTNTLVYSGDTLETPNLVEAARGANLFLCEATLSGDGSLPSGALPHMTAGKAANAAGQADVERLLLTHFWYLQNRDALLTEAKSIFPNTNCAEEFASYEV